MEISVITEKDGSKTCSITISEKDWRIITLHEDPKLWIEQTLTKELSRIRKKLFSHFNSQFMEKENITSIPTDIDQWLILAEEEVNIAKEAITEK